MYYSFVLLGMLEIVFFEALFNKELTEPMLIDSGIIAPSLSLRIELWVMCLLHSDYSYMFPYAVVVF